MQPTVQLSKMLDRLSFSDEGIVEITDAKTLGEIAGGSSDQLMGDMRNPMGIDLADNCGAVCKCYYGNKKPS